MCRTRRATQRSVNAITSLLHDCIGKQCERRTTNQIQERCSVSIPHDSVLNTTYAQDDAVLEYDTLQEEDSGQKRTCANEWIIYPLHITYSACTVIPHLMHTLLDELPHLMHT